MMNSDLNTSAEEFAVAQYVLLSSAKNKSDVDAIAKSIGNFFEFSFFNLHLLQQKKLIFREIISANESTTNKNQLHIGKLLSNTEITKKILKSNATKINRLINNDPTYDKYFFLPIIQNKNKIGVVLFNTNNEKLTKKYKKIILQLSTSLISANNRVYRTQQKHDLYKVTNQLFENSNESFCQWEEGRGWKCLNRHLLHRIGYDPLDFKVDNVFGSPHCINKEVWNKCQETLRKCIDSGKNKSIEYEVLASDGSLRIFQSKLVVQKRDAKGKAVEITGVSTDITDAKKMSQKALTSLKMDSWLLEINSQLYRNADIQSIKNSLKKIGEQFKFDKAIILTLEKSGDLKLFTQWSNNTLGVIDAVSTFDFLMTTKNYQQHSFEDTQQTYIPNDEKIRAEKFNYESQLVTPIYTNKIISGYIILQKEKPTVFSDLLLTSIKIISETFSMVITTSNILSDLESRRERFKLAMEAASYGLWEINLTTKEIYITKSYYSMLGIKLKRDSDEEKIFTPLNFKNIHVDDIDKNLRYINQLAVGEIESCSFESRHISIDGKITWLLIRGKVIKWDDTGKPFLATGTITNITQLKKSQIDLELAYQEAQSARIAKGEFLARMSHEIRTPMNAIIGMSFLSLQTHLDDKQRNYIKDIDKAAKSLLQIIDDILDYSKIEAGKLIIDKHPFNISTHIDRITSRYKPLALEKNLDFHFTIDPTIPEIILADSTRLRQVLSNLIDNAIKFTEKGSISLDVKKISDEEKEDILFIVSDTGIGLEPSQLNTLFEPFIQADGSSTRQFGGTGIGLAISHHLVELMGGHIQGTGTKGQGSQFRFSVPCISAEDINTKDTSRSSKAQQLTETNAKPQTGEGIANNEFIELAGKSVLLVEDNKVNQKVATGILKHQNMHVTIANNGTEAVYIMKASSKQAFDFILMDIEMPYMNGFEATESIRQLAPHKCIPIIAMTASMVNDNKDLYTRSGMNDSVSKPIAPEALYRVLQAQFHSSKTYI